MSTGLTERQLEAYYFIRGFIREHHMPPTLQEIATHFGFRSVTAAVKLVRVLEQQLYIKRDKKHRARCIQLLREEDNLTTHTLPIVGACSSHKPGLLRQRPEGVLAVDFTRQIQYQPDRCVVMRATDEGMNKAGILTNDMLLIEERDWKTLYADQIVAALVGERLLVRRFRSNSYHDQIELIADTTKRYKTQAFSTTDPECYIIGPVISVIRCYTPPVPQPMPGA